MTKDERIATLNSSLQAAGLATGPLRGSFAREGDGAELMIAAFDGSGAATDAQANAVELTDGILVSDRLDVWARAFARAFRSMGWPARPLPAGPFPFLGLVLWPDLVTEDDFVSAMLKPDVSRLVERLPLPDDRSWHGVRAFKMEADVFSGPCHHSSRRCSRTPRQVASDGSPKKITAPHPFGGLDRGWGMTTDSISQKKASTFRMECRVSINIHATPEKIWALLTNAADCPRWNSTVTSMKGSIAQGEKLELRVPVSDRTFTPKVTEIVPATRMVWSDGMAPMFKGERTFTLTPRADGTTDFEMVEIFSGVMLPIIRGSLPDFGPVFDRYALDLKKEAEGAAS